MTRVDSQLESAQTYTMRQLNQHTADVIREINDSGRPAAITRHGRFVALITPLANAEIESAVLGAVIEEAENSSQLRGERTTSGLQTPKEVAEDLDINLP